MTEPEKHYPLVLVTWVDCTTFRGWHTIKDSLDFTPDEVETVGFLLSEEETGYLRITASLSGKDGNLTLLDAMTIPRSWVTKVEVLGLVSSCGCGEKEEKLAGGNAEKLAAWRAEAVEQVFVESCWGAPEPEPEDLCRCGAGVGMSCNLCRPMKPLETIKGDEALDRQLTLDEHLRRGGKATDWIKGPERPAWLGKGLQETEQILKELD